ncbi:MAG: acyl-CoA dehydrogenase family protein [Alphaproteobacteria bacterium]
MTDSDQKILLSEMRNATMAARAYVGGIRNHLMSMDLGKDAQFLRHGHAWMAAYVETLGALLEWAEGLVEEGRFLQLESLIARSAFADYLGQLRHGIAMSQDEVIRPEHFDLTGDRCRRLADAFAEDGAVAYFRAFPVSRLAREIVDESMNRQDFGDRGLDETFGAIASQFEEWTRNEVTPHAHQWHLQDVLIPDEVVEKLSELGVFGLTIREEYGGTGLGKLAMCVVTEELSRGYIGVGSLGTRSEIAGELIQNAGTAEQKSRLLPKIASGEILPTAVFTEPNTGSDLASLKTRARRDGESYIITGNKTWITHAARSDLMTLLARTDPDEPGYRGLTMFLAEKTRGTAGNPFPDPGMQGGEIPVLGYRGMKEYDIGFDGFTVPASSVLGGEEGRGFRQLMNTFESARIQTAARALGVACNALDLAVGFAGTRVQFGRPIIEFERIYGKLARMIVEIMAVRQLAFMAARKKDQGGRCDVEAGMAKLLAARLSWSAADNALQIHGGIGYAQETPISRVLCDARILNIFEGAAEMQAEIIARGFDPAKG